VDRELLTVPEAARRLSLGRATAYLLVQRGELPVVRIGRAVRIPARALEAWIIARTTGGADTGDHER
jgi:excisionase family DNA binding protein